MVIIVRIVIGKKWWFLIDSLGNKENNENFNRRKKSVGTIWMSEEVHKSWTTIHKLAKSIDQESTDKNRLPRDQLVRFAEIDLINEILFSGKKFIQYFERNQRTGKQGLQKAFYG